MVIDAIDRFLDRYAETVLQVTKKSGPIKAALRVAHLPMAMRLTIKERVLELKNKNKYL